MSNSDNHGSVGNQEIDRIIVEERVHRFRNPEVAKDLGIAESTLRKYANLMDKLGYVVPKDSGGVRLFTKQDIEVVIMALKLKNEAKFQLEQAFNIAVTQAMGGKTDIAVTQSVHPSSNNDLLVESLEKMRHKLIEIQDQNTEILLKQKESEKQIIENEKFKKELLQYNEKLSKDNERFQEIIEELTSKVDGLEEMLNEKNLKKASKWRFWEK